VALLFLSLGCHSQATAAGPDWTSGNRYRILLTVDSRGQQRSNSPARVQIDFAAALAARGAAGEFDPATIEVMACDASGDPRVFDESRPGGERYLLPFRLDTDYRQTRSMLNFALPDHQSTRYVVYFDTRESGRGRPERYPGLIGDGDFFTDGYARREINACGYDAWCDLDQDGDLDIVKGGTEPFLYVYENVGASRFTPRGRLTSGGQLLTLPHDGLNRSWNSIAMHDWDRDGDPDLFVHSPTGPHAGHLLRFENIAGPGGPPQYVNRGPLLTASGKSLAGVVRFADFDGDGDTDLIGGRDTLIVLYTNTGGDGALSAMQIADGTYLKANGVDIQFMSAQVECADIDNDGDLDMFVGSEEGRIFWFENVGTRTAPVYTMGRVIIFHEFMDQRAAVKVADFDGDGLLDLVPGRYWERTQWGEQPRLYGRLYKNVGTPTAPRFEPRDASAGCPFTERFQMADAVRQNGVRGCDWNNDGLTDLIASDTDGWVWFFRNTTGHKFPVFAPGEKIQAGGRPLRVYGEERECRAAGYARCDISDWNNDGRKDLLVADGRGWLFLYLNEGTDAAPVLAEGVRVEANGKPIDGTARGSVLVCDYDSDGRKDVIFGMVGHGEISEYQDWPPLNANPLEDKGFLFYRNVGTDAAPVLAYPKWLRAGPHNAVITYSSRPNLGSFVDWDGDGRKDLIACEFEHNARFYRNTASPDPGTEPRYTESYDGQYIVQPWTVQMMSGADAIDFNRDGDIDIITGQGHGGSGLRFYERDYINDFVNEKAGLNTWPLVTAGEPESRVVRADLDGDDDVDMGDFGRFQACVSGSGHFPGAACTPSDFDEDGDVDSDDLSHFRECLNGANRPPGC
jgi:hypothetical protein